MSKNSESPLQLRLPDLRTPRRPPPVKNRSGFFGLGHIALQDTLRIEPLNFRFMSELGRATLTGVLDEDDPVAVAKAIAAVRGKPFLIGPDGEIVEEEIEGFGGDDFVL